MPEYRSQVFDTQCLLHDKSAVLSAAEAVKEGSASKGFSKVTGKGADVSAFGAIHQYLSLGQSGRDLGNIDTVACARRLLCCRGACPSDPVRGSAAHPSQPGGWAPPAYDAAGGTPLGGSTSPALAVRAPLMRTRYCIRYELGLCPVHQGAKDTGPLFLVNNGRRLSLGFDCARCEMTVSAVTN